MTPHDKDAVPPEHQREIGDRGARPELAHLDDLDDYKVADGEPDIRGWTVKSTDGQKIGKVDDLLVDTGRMMVRYLDVKLDKEVSGAGDDQHVLVPIATARLDDDHDDVLLGMSASEAAGAPPYTRGAWSSHDESALLGRYGESSSTDASRVADARASGPEADAERFFGTRRGGRDNTYISRYD